MNTSTFSRATGSILSPQDWETLFCKWAVGPADTEAKKAQNAERMVKEALRDWPALRARDISVFTQGSYRNRTNVRKESDVDVCVLCKNTFYPDYSHVEGVSSATFGFADATYGFDDLKNDVEAALKSKFGDAGVKRGDKAIAVHENTYRVSADVVPTFEGRLYYRNYSGNLEYNSGTVLRCDKTARRIKNWPEQHYSQGVAKHTATSRQFKKKARILKNLRNHMAGIEIASARPMASFLLESLVHNAPVELFSNPTHYEDMRQVVAWLWHRTKSDEEAKALLEVNRIKFLFHPLQGWTRDATHLFLQDVWGYVCFGNG